MGPSPSRNLHGSAPDTAGAALLLIDTINALEFENAEALLERALPMAKKIAALRERVRAAQLPCIYVNDNFGRWRSNFHALVEHCSEPDVLGRPIVELLKPSEEDYFVLKPKHSGFYETPLEVLLKHLGASTLILTGMAANLCVLYTANDAYMRDYRLIVPSDCVASETDALTQSTLEHMRRFLKADVRPSESLSSEALSKHHATEEHAGR